MATLATRRWLGVPYARAERFASPHPVPFDASGAYDRFGPAAPQPRDSPLGEIVPGMQVVDTDEHACLTLNVWAPPTGGPHPVLVWFHGGSFMIGASSQAVYDGALLSGEQSVVVVTVNSRLGALGFLDMRAAGGVANCGMRDALCALEWVREHIGSFGGDPARVVGFGESAGGGLLLHVLASPMSRRLLAGAIVQSGATFATLDDARAALVVETMCKEAAVTGAAGLRALPVDALLEAQNRALSTLLQPVGMMPFHPMVDGDVLQARPVDAIGTGAAAGVALIAGTTADEMALFVDRAALGRERLVRRIARYLQTDEVQAARVADHYAAQLGSAGNADVWRAFFGDREMQDPCRAVLDAHAPHGPAYTYCFTWEGPDAGACHGIDIPFPFGNFVDGWEAFAGIDADARALSRRMRDAWAAFARTGDPGWPQYPSAMILGREPHVAPSHPLFARIATA
ncbi:MAG TPA: carboxylesterase family protein [Acidimicrobiia bacterium]|nr:carboxylesterase family protein [Acidimicrobiia bacterium]